MPPTVSIILKTWNGLAYTRLCIESILRSTACKYELIVVDNGSSDGTVGYLKTIAGAKLVLNESNRGCMEGDAQGIQISKGEYICLLDNDVIVSDDWLEGLLDEFRRLKESRVGCIGPLQIGKDLVHPYRSGISSKAVWEKIISEFSDLTPQEQLVKFCYPKSYSEFAADFLSANSRSAAFLRCPPDYIGGSCILFSRKAFECVGGKYDFGSGLYAGDDVDFCWSLGKAGYPIYRSCRAYVHHFKHTSIRINQVDRERLNRQSDEHIFLKWDDELILVTRQLLDEGMPLEEIRHRYLMLDLFIDWLSPGTASAFR